jgi:GntR family transcriptional regulator of vanillate catabolism
MHGIFPGGQRLIETDLSQRLGLSRTPIREALIALAEERLVDYSRNVGYVVRVFQLSEILERFTVRSALEALACRIIMEKGMSAELRRNLSTGLAAGNAILSKPELSESDTILWGRMNDTFHRSIIEATANDTLIQLFNRVTQIPYAPAQIEWLSGANNRQPFETFHREHILLFERLSEPGARPDELMQSHILAAADYMKERFKVTMAKSTQAKRKAASAVGG